MNSAFHAIQLDAPGILSSRSTIGSDISFIFAVVFILSFLFAGRLAMKKKGLRHHNMILFSAFLMIAYLAYYYKIRQLGLTSAADQMALKNSKWFYENVFRPLMYLHIAVVASSLYLSLYMVLNGFSAKFPLNDGNLTLKTGLAKPSPILWGIGILWLIFLIWRIAPAKTVDINHKILIISLSFILPAAISLLIHFTLPKADVRHRVVGRITLAFFSILLITTVLIYSFIYLATY